MHLNGINMGLRRYRLGPSSFWHAYLQMLPELEDIGASFTWGEQDLQLLEGSLIRHPGLTSTP